MPKFYIFLDSSALISGAISELGAAQILLDLGESRDIILVVSELVIWESERSMARKSPSNLDDLRSLIRSSNLRIIESPSPREVKANLYLITDPNDVLILLAALKAKVDYLAIHNRKHFLDDPNVSERSGLRIGTPGDVLAWLRDNL